MRTVAVIYAGDDGAPGTTPDLLTPLAGQPIIGHSVAMFAAAPQVDGVLLVGAPDPAARQYRQQARIVAAAGPRVLAIGQALGTLAGTADSVLIHDAVRPLISPRVIADCAAALTDGEAVCAAVPASDTMVRVENQFIAERFHRDRLRHRQYPQGFSLPVIRRAYRLAAADPAFRPADDCGIVLRYLPEVAVALVWGSEQGFAITSPLDLDIAETMLRAGLP